MLINFPILRPRLIEWNFVTSHLKSQTIICRKYWGMDDLIRIISGLIDDSAKILDKYCILDSYVKDIKELISIFQGLNALLELFNLALSCYLHFIQTWEIVSKVSIKEEMMAVEIV